MLEYLPGDELEVQRYPSEVAGKRHSSESALILQHVQHRHVHVEEQKVVRAAALEKGGLKKGEGSGFMQDIRSLSM